MIIDTETWLATALSLSLAPDIGTPGSNLVRCYNLFTKRAFCVMPVRRLHR
jgi:hypothetical protein